MQMNSGKTAWFDFSEIASQWTIQTHNTYIQRQMHLVKYMYIWVKGMQG